MDWGAFFAMGGYGMYVWPAYIAAAIVLLANVLAPLRTKTKVLKRVRLVAQARATAPSKRAPKRRKKNENAA